MNHKHPEHHESKAHGTSGHKDSYKRLGIELALDFVIMYAVMYTMLATLDHFHLNLNTTYMTLMMLAPMALLMLFTMRSMFPARKLNTAISAGAGLVLLASYVGMRTQAGVGDADFLRAMIPHHSGAILMCEEAALDDPRITELCSKIVATQEAEIAQMEEILDSY
jgi:uncharacterized protein (DUF305 family)